MDRVVQNLEQEETRAEHHLALQPVLPPEAQAATQAATEAQAAQVHILEAHVQAAATEPLVVVVLLEVRDTHSAMAEEEVTVVAEAVAALQAVLAAAEAATEPAELQAR